MDHHHHLYTKGKRPKITITNLLAIHRYTPENAYNIYTDTQYIHITDHMARSWIILRKIESNQLLLFDFFFFCFLSFFSSEMQMIDYSGSSIRRQLMMCSFAFSFFLINTYRQRNDKTISFVFLIIFNMRFTVFWFWAISLCVAHCLLLVVAAAVDNLRFEHCICTITIFENC